MTAHPIPANADLVDLVLLNKRWEIEDACLVRKLKRLAKLSAAAHKGAHTRWINEHANLRRSNIRARNPFGGMDLRGESNEPR